MAPASYLTDLRVRKQTSTFPKISNNSFNVSFSLIWPAYDVFMFFLPGVQQNATSRVISPGEKPLQQAEPVNSHHKTKKLRLEESLPGGFIIILPNRFITSVYHSLMQDDSLCVWIFHCPPFSFYLYLSPTCRSLISCLSGVSLWGGERGSAGLRPEESWSEESPRCWWAEGSRCCLPPCLPASLPSPPLPAFSSFCCLNLSVKEPYIVLDICLYLYHSSV